jgi:DNA polymerase
MQCETEPHLRAWIEYFRDLGVYDFYRLGEPVPLGANVGAAGSTAQAIANEIVDTTQSAAIVNAVIPQARVSAAPIPPTPSIAPNVTPKSVVSFVHDATSTPPIAESLSMPPVKLVSFNDLAPMPAAKIPAVERGRALRAIQDEIGDCTRCPLAYAGRRKIVFGDGSATARLMFVGEGPGADEDTQGLPFVGKAGQLLNNMIGAMGLGRAEVYIANIVKCRPPSNRVPEPAEANVCTQFLLRQIDVVQPEVIVALGATAATYLLGVKQSLSSLRGRWHRCRGAKLAVTYHPAFLLRDPRQKAEAWKDLQMVMRDLGLTPPAPTAKA